MPEVVTGMSRHTYPLTQFKHLVHRIEQPSFLHTHRRWVGNDDIDHHYHIAIPYRQDPVYIHLYWKRGTAEVAEFIGTYRFNVDALLTEGYIRKDGRGKVRVRICHGSDDLLYIQTRSGNPALAIGMLSQAKSESG